MTRHLFCCSFACSLIYFFLSRFLSFMLSFRPSSFLFLIIPILRPAWANLGNYKKGKIIDSLLLSMEIITIRFLYPWWDISIWACQRYGKTSHMNTKLAWNGYQHPLFTSAWLARCRSCPILPSIWWHQPLPPPKNVKGSRFWRTCCIEEVSTYGCVEWLGSFIKLLRHFWSLRKTPLNVWMLTSCFF